MAWDASRTVPWKRLTIEWTVVAVIVAGVSYFVTDNRQLSSYLTIVFAGVVYVGFGAILAKFGYARKSLAQLRAETVAAAPAKAAAATTGARPKPAPTSRTSTGPSQRPNKKKR